MAHELSYLCYKQAHFPDTECHGNVQQVLSIRQDDYIIYYPLLDYVGYEAFTNRQEFGYLQSDTQNTEIQDVPKIPQPACSNIINRNRNNGRRIIQRQGVEPLPPLRRCSVMDYGFSPSAFQR